MSVEDPPLFTLTFEFELRCDAVHPVHCDERLCSGTRQGVVALACEHGAQAHGFTRGWYSPRRQQAMADQVRRRSG